MSFDETRLMQNRLTDLTELRMRTVEAACFSGGMESLFITFTDGTWIEVEANRGYDNDLNLEVARDKLDPNDIGSVCMEQLGWMTREEFDAYLTERRRVYEEEREARERQEYERLRAKFQGEKV